MPVCLLIVFVMRIHLINIGDEILIGQIVNTNAAWMGQQLNLIGARLVQVTTIGDDHDQILDALQQAVKGADAVLLTGGLGPTKDDVTKKALAAFWGVELVFHPPTFERLTRIFARFNRPTTEAHKEQCLLPANAEVLTNYQGTAPGLWMEHGQTVVVSMPGVPYEMEHLMAEAVMPRLTARFGGEPILHRTILTVGEGETILAERIADIEDALPPHIRLAYLPNLGQVRLRLTGRGTSEQQLAQELDSWKSRLKARLGDLIFGEGNQRLEEAVGNMLKEAGLRVATAESCTGGYLAHLLTSVPGSSAYFMGSIVAYGNAVKMSLLGVPYEEIHAHGAVSEQVVKAMADGARQQLAVDIAVAVSGIAGPEGGTPDKPVGTVWLAISTANETRSRQLLLGKDRIKNIQLASVYALDLIRKSIMRISNKKI